MIMYIMGVSMKAMGPDIVYTIILKSLESESLIELPISYDTYCYYYSNRDVNYNRKVEVNVVEVKE
jgi:hypothetical protein